MRLLTIILTLIGLLTVLTSSGQHALNDENIRKANAVKAMTVYNCLGGDCIKDYYEFNRNGQLTRERPAVVHMYEEWKYFPDGKLKARYVKQYAQDSLWSSEHYHYSSNGELEYFVELKYENNEVVLTDTLVYAEEITSTEHVSPKLNKQGQVVEEELGDLYFPCAIIL